MIVQTAALSLRLLRSGGPRAWTSAALVAAGVVVGTALLAVALGAVHGWDAREARTGWRADGVLGTAAPADPVALVRTQTDAVAGRPLDVVDLAPLRPGTAPPPGFERMPGPGEVWVTPAVVQLLAELPADRLADRFPGPPAGMIAEAGLREPGELAVVIGRDVAALRSDAGPDPVAVARFDGAKGQLGQIEVYRQLTYVAVALLVFPIATLLGASARLTAARRTQRLATLRLLGASTTQVTVVAVAEVTALAVVAAGVGVALQWALSPALAGIELAGSGWFAADLRPSLPVSAAIVAGVALLATVAALDGMRQVVVSPLGVARRDRPRGVRMLRLLGAAAGIAVFVIVNSALRISPAAVGGLVFGVGVLALFGVVSLIGPLVVRLLARRMVRSARAPAALLAGRRLLDDPKGAFRPLAGVVLAVFVASFLAPLTGAVTGQAGRDDRALVVTAPDRDPAALTFAVREQLARRGIDAAVEPAPQGPRVRVIPDTGEDRDRVRTALAPLTPGRVVVTERESSVAELALVADLTRGALIVVVGTFLVAATATGTAAAARVLDQRRTLRLLHLAGTPLGVLDAARRVETIRPLLVNGAIALALGLLCASPFASAAQALDPDALLLLGAVLAGGVALVAAASAASRPLLRSVTTAHGREP